MSRGDKRERDRAKNQAKQAAKAKSEGRVSCFRKSFSCEVGFTILFLVLLSSEKKNKFCFADVRFLTISTHTHFFDREVIH